MDYKNKYLKYKTKYIQLKNNNMIGGGIKLTDDNTTIEKEIFKNDGENKIVDPNILKILNNAYKTKITEFIPHSDKDGEAIMWKIYYKNSDTSTGTDTYILVGFGVTTDLSQFEKYPNFKEKGGIKDAKGLYITSVAGDPEYSGIVNILFKNIDKYANENKYDYLLLEAKKYEPDNYLLKIYEKQGFILIKELTEEGETGTLMCKNIKEGFDCFEKINNKN